MDSKNIKKTAANEEDMNKRLDVFASEKFALTRSAVQKMIDNGGILPEKDN